MIPASVVPSRPSLRIAERCLTAAVWFVGLSVAWFYYWTVESTAADLNPRGQKSDYYNLLVEGFADGHLYMKAEPDARLLALPPAERPGATPFLLDASLYGNHYYLYFGVAPVMVLYLPYAVLTGDDMPEALAAVLFMLAGFGFATAWWLGVRRQFFPRLSVFWTVLGVVALGFCTAVPSALRRPLFYEVAIGAGYAFSMASLWAVMRAWRRPAQRLWWLAIAGVAVGLAVGSRANLAPAGMLLLCAAAVGAARSTVKRRRVRLALLALVAAGGGAGVVGVGLAGYNYARFGSITEFGHHYQLGVVPKEMFHAGNLTHNFALYYLKPPVVNGYFPFVAPADEGPKPEDYVGREQAHGEWLWTLLVGVTAAAAAVSMRMGVAHGLRWLGVLALPALVFAVNVVVVALTGVRANRYMLDFHPALVLATLMALAAGLELRGWRGGLVRVIGASLLVTAAVFNVLASVQVHGFFRATSPAAFARWAEVADGAVWPLLRGAEATVGDRVVELRWPRGMKGRSLQPLVTAGSKDFADTLWVEFDGMEKVRVVFSHGVYGDVSGEWFSWTPGAKAKVTVSGAFLLPRVGHPWYGARARDAQSALKSRLRVRVDGRLVFDRDVGSYDSSPSLQLWGKVRPGTVDPTVFAGVIEQVKSVPPDEMWVRVKGDSPGAHRFSLMLPRDRYGWMEPLWQSGNQEGFDTLSVHYVRPGVIRLLHDQLAGGGRWSEEFKVDYNELQRVEVESPWASDGLNWTANGPIETKLKPQLIAVRWNGRDVFRPQLPPLPGTLIGTALGVNTCNASGSAANFAGALIESPRLERLAGVGTGGLEFKLDKGEVFRDERGVLLKLRRTDGETAALVWRRSEAPGQVYLGWLEGGAFAWFGEFEAGDEVAGFTVRMSIGSGKTRELRNERPSTWIEAAARNKPAFAHKTDFFSEPMKDIWALYPEHWTSLQSLANAADSAATVTLRKPGRMRMRFVLPKGGFVGGDPLISAGRSGAADSIFLRGLGGDRYVVGLDHWGGGGMESAPVILAALEVHTLLIELGSLNETEKMSPNHVRMILDGRPVVEATCDLYPVRAGEVVFGQNPLGMSTSNASFRGEIISVRLHASAEDVR